MTQQVLYAPELLHFSEATLCESDSFYVVSHYKESFPSNVEYTVFDYSLEQVLKMSGLFSTFHGRISISKNSTTTVPSTVPIDTLRYKMLQDQSWWYVDTIPSSYRPGYIVEGAIWSNGMYYIVRDENIKNNVLDAYLSIDPYTKSLYNYP